MTDPCRYCVAPERYPGCHDHCEKLKAYRESDEYKKHKGLHMMGYKGMGV